MSRRSWVYTERRSKGSQNEKGLCDRKLLDGKETSLRGQKKRQGFFRCVSLSLKREIFWKKLKKTVYKTQTAFRWRNELKRNVNIAGSKFQFSLIHPQKKSRVQNEPKNQKTKTSQRVRKRVLFSPRLMPQLLLPAGFTGFRSFRLSVSISFLYDSLISLSLCMKKKFLRFILSSFFLAPTD